MSNVIEAIEDRIRASPGDNEAWKVYADWLLDQGDARGELILLELQLGKGEDRARDAIAAITDEHRASWQPTPTLPVQVEYGWLHGFVRGATVKNIGQAEDLRSLRRLFADPQARLLSALKLHFRRPVDATVFESLAELDLGNLSWFCAGNIECADALVDALVRQPTLQLSELDLRHVGLSDVGLLALAECTRLRGLRKLHLMHNDFGAEGVLALANSPVVSELEELDLRENAIGVRGASALANSPFLGRLATLRLYADDIGKDGIAALASSTTLPRKLVRDWQART
jgi:uncharacterized protein (TIGR02996 family)